jgi:mRNA interferase RelE/StbE
VTHAVLFRPTAEKALGKLDKEVRARVLDAVRALAGESRPDGCKKLKGKLRGAYRIRVGDWRVLYVVDDKAKTVLIEDIDKRGDIY